MTDAARKPVALVIGAGDATGGAVARRFAREGYTACVTRRDEAALQPLLDAIRAAGGTAHGIGLDVGALVACVGHEPEVQQEAGPRLNDTYVMDREALQ